MSPTSRSLATLAAAGTAALAVAWLLRRRKFTHAAAAPAIVESSPPPLIPLTIVADGSADASNAVADALIKALSGVCACEREDIAPRAATRSEMKGQGCYVFVVECDKEGEAPAIRGLVKSLKPLKGKGTLEVHVAVLALAFSVCAFSAASGGSDKYRGGKRLQTTLVDAGATLLTELGTAEVELTELDESVLPWARTLQAAIVEKRTS